MAASHPVVIALVVLVIVRWQMSKRRKGEAASGQ